MRCFIAVDINGELAKKLTLLVHSLKQVDSSLSIVEDDYHLTIAFLGEIDDKKAADIAEKMHYIDAKRFEVRLKGVGCFRKNERLQTIWVAVRGFSDELVEEIDKITGEKRTKPFTAHITLARVKRKPNDDIFEWLKIHANDDIGTQTFDKVFLKKSTLIPSGAVHETVFEKELK